MIIGGKRFERVSVFRHRGCRAHNAEPQSGPAYLMQVTVREPAYPGGRGFYLIGTVWAGVGTRDLREGWSARLFQQIVPARNHCVTECSPRDAFYGPTVGWHNVPPEWRRLFLNGLRSDFPELHAAIAPHITEVDA